MKVESTSEEKSTVKVLNCARCDTDHPCVPVKKFVKHGIMEYTHWATCPLTGEPILVAYEPDDTTPPDAAPAS